MKKLFNPLIKKIVKNKITWLLCTYILRFGEWLRFERNKYEYRVAEEKLKIVFFDLTVKNGYFQGLKYPSASSFGSSLYPKLSGSYESELARQFQFFESQDYNKIIDIGCAEGFYAVGLALKFTNTNIIAFDIAETARELCKEMASLNNVQNRVTILAACTAPWLKELESSSRNLIICDCEGFERHLFDSTNIESLENSDLIIELHPFVETGIANYLFHLFGKSHHIELVSSFDNARKLFELPQEYNSLSPLGKLLIVEEGRPMSMDWMILSPKELYKK